MPRRDVTDMKGRPVEDVAEGRKLKRLLLAAVRSSLSAADPEEMVCRAISVSDSQLTVKRLDFSLPLNGRVLVIGGGKASGKMALAVERMMGSRLTSGIVNVPRGARQPILNRIELHPAGHPLPDNSGLTGVKRMLEMVGRPNKTDLILCLISGGGSSLLPLPADDITLRDKVTTTRLLLLAGANIVEINTVRKHLSGIKGGWLAKRLFPAVVISLIVSDVVGDRLDMVASGPTLPDSTTFKDARNVLDKYSLWEILPERVRMRIEAGQSGSIEETPKQDDPCFKNVRNILVGRNRDALNGAKRFFAKKGYAVHIFKKGLSGEASEAGRRISEILRFPHTSGDLKVRPAAFIVGGETTVTVSGDGIGGRNQELALSVALGIAGSKGRALVAFGTDGIDGPTPAAGAYVDGSTVKRGLQIGMDARRYLRNNDSYTYFKSLGDLIITGWTGTNVNDVVIGVLH
jgi:glycerate 2-kinase